MKIRKRYMTTVLILSSILVLSGCAQKNITNGSSGEAASPTASADIQVTPGETVMPLVDQVITIVSYYADVNGEKLVSKDTEIRFETEESKYMAALATLKESADPNVFPLAAGLIFHSTHLENGVLSVDVSVLDEGRLGSSGEQLLLDALYQTLFQFTEVETIDILVDGKQIESLMGHVGLQHPYQRALK